MFLTTFGKTSLNNYFRLASKKPMVFAFLYQQSICIVVGVGSWHCKLKVADKSKVRLLGKKYKNSNLFQDVIRNDSKPLKLNTLLKKTKEGQGQAEKEEDDFKHFIDEKSNNKL